MVNEANFFFLLSSARREKEEEEGRETCHQSRMSLYVVNARRILLEWKCARMTTANISNSSICPAAVADESKGRQICFFEIGDEPCLFSKHTCVCETRARACECVCVCVLRERCHDEPSAPHWLADDRQESVRDAYVYTYRAQLFTVNYLRT